MKIPKNWTFKNKEVALNFDKHVRDTLPWYDISTNAVIHIARHYINDNGLVYDIGASTGNIGKKLKQTLDDRNAELIAIEPSYEMANLYNGGGQLQVISAENVQYKPFDVAICFLSLMFVESEKRPKLLLDLYNSCKKGGVIIILDKAESQSGYLGTVLYRMTLDGKLKQGITPEDIIKKEMSLSGVQRPIEHRLLEEYNPITWFQFGEFKGWLIQK
jgi:tRNA (cmo5U34)-methyltransferase